MTMSLQISSKRRSARLGAQLIASYMYVRRSTLPDMHALMFNGTMYFGDDVLAALAHLARFEELTAMTKQDAVRSILKRYAEEHNAVLEMTEDIPPDPAEELSEPEDVVY